MKISIINILVISMLTLIYMPSFSQSTNTKEAKFKVEGVCGMCKTRIENAAYIKGVKSCDWNKETKELKVIYKPDRVSEMDIHTSISKAGHQTDSIAAQEKAYKNLPGCCAYNDGVKTH